MRRWIGALVLAVVAAGCASATSSPERAAEMRAAEVELAAKLAAEGQDLYVRDDHKRPGYEYCSRAGKLSERGEFRLAIREASKALYLGQTGSDEGLLAAAKRDLALAYSFAGALEPAAQMAAEAIAHAYRSTGDRTRTIGPMYKVIADVRARQGRTAEAIKEYERALAASPEGWQTIIKASLANAYLRAGNVDRARVLFREAEARAQGSQRAIIGRGLGEVALVEGRHDAAARLFGAAAAQASGDDADYHRLWALDGVARARRAAGDAAGAVAAWQDALAAAERVRARFRSDEFKTGFFGDIQRVFDEAVGALAEAGRAEDALALSERSRARALLDLVRDRTRTSAGAEVFADPFARPVPLADLRAALPADTALVAYHVRAERTHAWVVRRDGVTPVTLAVAQPALRATITRLREAMRQRTDAAAPLGAELYGMLVAPLGLRPGEALVLVPHDTLHYLPFQALRGPAGYLAEERPLSYAPSASVFAQLAARPVRARRVVLALGNPDLGNARLALPGAQREAERIGALFSGAEVYVLKDASKERLVARAPASDLIHVGAHADLDAVDPMYSVIRLARTDKATGELEAHEVYRLSLPRAALVTLSACETGLGRVTRGDEVWGFTRAFLGAGAPAMLVSLWPVEDAATARLMERFYDALRTQPAQAALRTAQLEVLGNPETAHPFFWAPFVLVGDPR
jgi:CHAT domain-containing protein